MTNNDTVPIPEDGLPVPITVETFDAKQGVDPFLGKALHPRNASALDARKVCKPPEPWQQEPPWLDADENGLTRRAYSSYGLRAAAAVYSLTNGCTYRSACVRAGLKQPTFEKLRQTDPAFNDIVTAAWDAGFVLLEDELVMRALAGSDDRGSIRALELALKSRDPNYRDQRTVDVTLRAAAANARQRVIASRGDP